MDIANIIKQVNTETVYIPQYQKILEVYEGALNKHVSNALALELKPESYRIAQQRIPSINLLRRIVKKLSKVYSETPERTVLDEQDQEILNDYCDDFDLQNLMSNAEDLLNLQRCFAIEVYPDDDSLGLRLLGPNEFTVLSNNSHDPMEVTVLIKMMGCEDKDDGQGKVRQVKIYWIYTDELFTIANSDGDILDQQINPYGCIPFVYCNSSAFYLKPLPDLDSFDNTVLIPKLLTDLNFATRFQSHSIMYTIDAEINEATGSPDSLWNLKSRDGENKTPTVGVLSPSVDVDKVLALIGFTVSQWLESRGIRGGTVGSLKPTNAASGISKIVDEADTTQVVNENKHLLVNAETELWEIVGKMHNYLVGSPNFEFTRGLAEDFEVSVAFPVEQVLADPKEKRDDLLFKLQNGLISHIRALRISNPDLSEEEILQLQAEIEAEKANKVIQAQQNLTNINVSNNQFDKKDNGLNVPDPLNNGTTGQPINGQTGQTLNQNSNQIYDTQNNNNITN